MKEKFFVVLVTIAIIVFCLYDYKSDKVYHQEEDLLNKIEARGYLIAGVKTDTRPFGYIKDGKNVGFDIDIAKRIARDIFHDESKIKFVEVTPSTRLYKLNSGEVDIIVATMTITAERQKLVNFSSPYFVAQEAVLVRSNSRISSLYDLSGHSVGILYGSTGEKDAKLLVPTSNLVGYKTYHEAYLALKSGLISAIISGDTLLRHFTLVDPSVKLLPKKYSKEPYAVAVRKNMSTERLLDLINMNITSMVNDGTLLKLKRKWKLD